MAALLGPAALLVFRTRNYKTFRKAEHVRERPKETGPMRKGIKRKGYKEKLVPALQCILVKQQHVL